MIMTEIESEILRALAKIVNLPEDCEYAVHRVIQMTYHYNTWRITDFLLMLYGAVRVYTGAPIDFMYYIVENCPTLVLHFFEKNHVFERFDFEEYIPKILSENNESEHRLEE